MLSLKLILVLLAVILATWLLARSTRGSRARNNFPHGPASQTSSHRAETAGAQPRARSGDSWSGSAASQVTQHSLDKQNIVIDADRPIDPDLAAALEQADAEIRLGEEQSLLPATPSSADHDPLTANMAVLEPRPADGPEPEHGGYGPDVSISDAELVEPVQPTDRPADLTALQIESNSAQLMLIDSFTDILIGTDNLNRSVNRVSGQSEANRLSRSKIHAEQQRKLILANARASKQNNDIKAERKVRHAAEKLIAKQQQEIKRVRGQMSSMKKTLSQRQAEIESQRLQLARAKMMARSAAKLARRAALTQQQAKDIAENEKKLRHKVESRTQQAISIAKNAISALAEQEKKNRVDSLLN